MSLISVSWNQLDQWLRAMDGFLRLHRHPHFFACDGMLQHQVAAFAGPHFDKPGSLQLADHLCPRHPNSVNLSVGLVNRAS